MSSKPETVSFFVIAKKDTADLVTSVMHAGREGKEDAVIVFTQQAAAETYLNQAGWVETETTAELEPAAFLKWLIKATQDGPTLIAVNPDRVHQDDGMRQTVIPVDDFLNELGTAMGQSLTKSECAPV